MGTKHYAENCILNPAEHRSEELYAQNKNKTASLV